jgi:hypothetical protein
VRRVALALVASCAAAGTAPELSPYPPEDAHDGICGSAASSKPPLPACEPNGSRTATALNMLHYRLDEATKARAANDKPRCVRESWAAAAIATGLPRFRTASQHGGHWVANLTYLTRWDGNLSEPALFAKAAADGSDAATLYAACDGATPLPAFTDDDLFPFARR